MPMELASARKAGKDPTVRPWIRTLCNVYQIARLTEPSTWTPKPATVNRNGAVMIVPKVRPNRQRTSNTKLTQIYLLTFFILFSQNYAIWIVDNTVVALAKHAHVTMDGAVNIAIPKYAMPDAMSMANARTAHACVLPAGMESIALSKDARLVVRVMVNVGSAVKVYGNAVATMAGTVPTVPLHWNKIALITRTMTKVWQISNKTFSN